MLAGFSAPTAKRSSAWAELAHQAQAEGCRQPGQAGPSPHPAAAPPPPQGNPSIKTVGFSLWGRMGASRVPPRPAAGRPSSSPLCSRPPPSCPRPREPPAARRPIPATLWQEGTRHRGGGQGLTPEPPGTPWALLFRVAPEGEAASGAGSGAGRGPSRACPGVAAPYTQ